MKCINKSIFPVDVQTCFSWHERPGALERCIPPWERVSLVKRIGSIQPGGEVHLRIYPAGFPLKWISHHVEYEKNVYFKDLQYKGPFKTFIHTHTFSAREEGRATSLTDHVVYELPAGALGRLFAPSIHRQLQQSFLYRHNMLRNDLRQHSLAPGKPQTILISGASGLVGQNLVPFLTTGGHRVIRLVRRPAIDPDELYWNPAKGELNLDQIGHIDAIINLSGENIGKGRWTSGKKERIINSRIQTTGLLVKKMRAMVTPPKVFISSSAIGYYGERGKEEMTESSTKGTDFISEVCDIWEQEAMKGAEFMRVVTPRIGVVLSPKGGALAKLLTPAKLGLGGPLGHGRQIMSWIAINDLIYAFHHCLFHDEVKGPINLTAPNPVSNCNLAQTLGRKLRRPAILPVPAPLIKLIFGQMGQEIPLASTLARPDKLLNTGYQFSHPNLDTALDYLIGTIVKEPS